MTGPLGNSEFCFLNVSLDFVSEILGKQNSLFPSGPVIKCELSRELYFCFYYNRVLVNNLVKFGVTLKIIYRATLIPWSSQAIVDLVSFFFHLATATEGSKELFLKEIEFMKQIGSHRNVLSMLGYWVKSEPIMLILEYVPHGDLLQWLRGKRQQVRKC